MRSWRNGSDLVREERRMVTAMSVDVVGSTALGEQMDPEDVREVIDGAIRLVIVAVESFGGMVTDLAGDGAMCIFGAPVAHEDDAERAILAGLRIADDVRAYGQQLIDQRGLPEFAVRIGIESGLAVLGAKGTGGMVAYAATGDALNTRRGSRAQAEPGTVLVGEATQRQVAPLFDWSDTVALPAQGEGRCRASIHALSAPGWNDPGLSDVAAPMIGRDRESRWASAALERLGRGEGGIVFVSGEPGMGKSRLVAEWRSAAGEIRWLESRCLSYRTTMPMAAFPELLAGLAPSGASEAEIAAELDALLGQGGGANGARISRRSWASRDPRPSCSTTSRRSRSSSERSRRSRRCSPVLLSSLRWWSRSTTSTGPTTAHFERSSGYSRSRSGTRSSSSWPFATMPPSRRSGSSRGPSRSRISAWKWCGSEALERR